MSVKGNAENLRTAAPEHSNPRIISGGGSLNSVSLTNGSAKTVDPTIASEVKPNTQQESNQRAAGFTEPANKEGLACAIATDGSELPGEYARAQADEQLHLSASQLRVLGVIAAAGGRQLTKDRIAELADCSKKTVDRALSRFTREGLVEVRACYASNGGQLANEYVIPAFQSQKPNSTSGLAGTSACPPPCAQNADAP